MIVNYNKILKIDSKSEYPFNLISNLKDNIIETKKEIELEYIKGFKVVVKGGNDKTKQAGIFIYEY